MELEQLLEQLHTALANDLLKKVQSGEASASDLNVARQFLKDNGIDIDAMNAEKNKPIQSLAKVLPFSNE